VAGAKYITSWLSYWKHGFNRLFEGKPTELVRNGELDRKGMRQELMNEQEVFASLRLQGVSDMRTVKKAVMEVDGHVSVILEDWAEPLQKSDVLGPQADQLTGEEKRTDTPYAIEGAR
jgi:uncharacterized membrane protein YcaP (DUF421 family)